MRGRILWIAAFLTLSATTAWAAGQIEGTVTNQDGGIGGVTVVVNEAGLVALSENDGTFRFNNVPAGSYTLTFNLGDDADSEADVKVTDGGATTVDKSVDWELTFAETITVFSASRRRERIVDAPAAVTVISEQQIAREATHGQLPKLLEFTPGAEATQSGLYDFNLNSRGFNSSLNRRLLLLIDGRDPSVTFLGSQEYTSMTVPLDSMASVEMVRGPGSALYGADAFNGVINMITKAPRDSQGGRVKLSGGELDSKRVDFSYTGGFGQDWYGRVTGGYLESEDFSVSRNQRVEYEGLGLEPIPLPRSKNEAFWGNLRVDKHFGSGQTLSLEAGQSDFQGGGASVTGIGRVQAVDTVRPYFRLNFNTQHWNFQAYYNDRDADDTISLRSTAPLFLDSDRTAFEVQGNVGFAGGKGQLVGGASYMEETFNSLNPRTGRQTLVFAPVEGDFTGVFGQIEYDVTDKVKAIVAGRFDDSSLHESQFSPRVALVWSITAKNTLRFNYGEAFQTPNYSEFFLQVPVALPTTAFAGLEAGFCAPFGVSCGFDVLPVLALGNPDIEVEEVESFEVGYSGVLGSKAFLTVDYYNNKITNFITDLIPAFNGTLGLLNPAFGPYQAPAGLPATVAATLEATVGALAPTVTNHPLTGAALLKAVTYTNFGEVETQGIEVGFNTRLTDKWLLNVTYNWFDFSINQELAEDPIQPNAPRSQFGLGISYLASKFDVGVNYRHVDGFLWAAGVFVGQIPDYDLMDLTANYHISDRIEIGLNISNLVDEEHFQIFGGDLIQRRALAHIAFNW